MSQQMCSYHGPIHGEGINIANFNKSIENLEIPKVRLNQIYQQSKYKFSKNQIMLSQHKKKMLLFHILMKQFNV